ncbi:IS5 family transposase [Gloeocapsopsis dulcis]|uniref:IS5 family transposase n=1 Tax=Gloeocapsopsis dulcis TaxID=2859516 RepID=UPI002B26423A|nr:IS5 family transposase [Gloeocapsopsis dulcis]WNN90855.1 IS5 family transposase [Gloeocapsopsis dulcis]WNN92169.1 IS5 family transposase [Gloeocapsopsis dulcis]
MVLSPQTRQFYRAKERAAKRYSSDLTDQEWEVIRPLLPSRSQGRGRKQQVDEREILNGIFYQLRNGCIWSDLPKDLPAWQTVYKYFRRWQRKGYGSRSMTNYGNQSGVLLEEILMLVQVVSTVKPSKRRKKGEVYGFDGGKLVKGRKRFILVDTLGLLISVLVINANCSEQKGGVCRA